MSDERLDLLSADNRQRHRHVQPSAELEPQVHILTQQLGSKRDPEVEIDKGGRFVPREHRAHHALVEKIEKRVPRYPCFLSEYGDLRQRLRNYAEEHVVANLDGARELAFTPPGGALTDSLEERPSPLISRPGAGYYEGEL